MAGLSPLAPGWSVFEVRPQLATVPRLQACSPALGLSATVCAEVWACGTGHALRVEVPAGAKARLCLPAVGTAALRLNGTAVATLFEGRFACTAAMVGPGQYAAGVGAPCPGRTDREAPLG